MKHKNLFDTWKRSYVVAVFVSASLISYFFVSTYILPGIYLRVPKPKPVPVISKANVSSPVIHLGNTIYFDLQVKNKGDDADMQIISIAFPTLTRTDTNVYIRQSDLTQKPMFINIGDKVGSDYTGLENIVYAKYPSI